MFLILHVVMTFREVNGEMGDFYVCILLYVLIDFDFIQPCSVC